LDFAVRWRLCSVNRANVPCIREKANIIMNEMVSRSPTAG
jgi:hypothetical protein